MRNSLFRPDCIHWHISNAPTSHRLRIPCPPPTPGEMHNNSRSTLDRLTWYSHRYIVVVVVVVIVGMIGTLTIHCEWRCIATWCTPDSDCLPAHNVKGTFVVHFKLLADTWIRCYSQLICHSRSIHESTAYASVVRVGEMQWNTNLVSLRYELPIDNFIASSEALFYFKICTIIIWNQASRQVTLSPNPRFNLHAKSHEISTFL